MDAATNALTGSAGGKDPPLDYGTLIRAVMRVSGVSAKKLYQNKVIRRCTFREFDKRLVEGLITTAELNSIFTYLDIDPVRATLALFILNSPDAYFDPGCETASQLASETVVALLEQLAACDGDFEPIKRGLCKSLAERTSGMIVEHHKRVEEVRTSAFG